MYKAFNDWTPGQQFHITHGCYQGTWLLTDKERHPFWGWCGNGYWERRRLAVRIIDGRTQTFCCRYLEMVATEAE